MEERARGKLDAPGVSARGERDDKKIFAQIPNLRGDVIHQRRARDARARAERPRQRLRAEAPHQREPRADADARARDELRVVRDGGRVEEEIRDDQSDEEAREHHERVLEERVVVAIPARARRRGEEGRGREERFVRREDCDERRDSTTPMT